MFLAPSLLQRSGFTSAAELARAGVEAVARASVNSHTGSVPQPHKSPAAETVDDDDIPLDLECTATVENHHAERLYDQYLVVAVNYNAFERHPTTGFPLTTPREVVQKFLAIVFNSLSMAGAHAEGLPYEASKVGVLPTLACTMDLPSEAEEVAAYAKDLRFNSKTERIVFHVHFRSSIRIAELKKHISTPLSRRRQKLS